MVKPVENKYLLTRTEYGIYSEEMKRPGTTVYNLPHFLYLGTDISVERLEDAVRKTFEAHPYLKIRLFADENGYVYKRQEEGDVEIDLVDVPSKDFDRRSFVRPFELLKEPLYRVMILRIQEEVCLFTDFHHIIFDLTSQMIFYRDLSRAYQGEALQKEKKTGNDVSVEEAAMRETVAFAEAREYYRSVFEGIELESVPFQDRNEETEEVEVFDYPVTRLDIEGVRNFSHEAEVRISTIFNAAFGYVLAGLANTPDSLYMTVFNSRNQEMADTVGMFVKTYPVYCNPAAYKDCREYLKALESQVDSSRKYSVYSFADACEELKIHPRVLFAYQGKLVQNHYEFNGRLCRREFCHARTAMEPLTIELFQRDGKFLIRMEYNRGQFARESMEILAKTLEQVAYELVHKEKLADITIVSQEQLTLLDQFNKTEVAYDKVSVVEQFRRQVALVPDNPAVVYLDKTYTYAQVDEITERIAGYLNAKGIGREDVVSVLIPRCEYMVIASLGVLKAGAAYQPLDPTYPKERLGFMMQDAGTKLLIAEKSLLSLAEEYKGEVLLTKDIPSLPACERIEENPAPEDLFILLYTSGSTGVPKGVMLEHHNLTAFCHWYRNFYELTPKSRVAAYASYGFDADMMDLYPTLTAGACVHIIDESIRLDLMALNNYFEENGITHSFMTTQVGRQFAAEIKNRTLKALSVGGEKLVPVEPPRDYKLYNAYGPTECTIFITLFPVDKLYHRVPIGKALDNVKLYVVDKEGRRLPPGMPGELWIAGHQVARGYLNRPEQTEKVFIQNPFCHEDGYERVYRTGDIVRFLPDGSIDFIGRNDGQVKIRGFRIELSEVERVIRQYPGIKDATVADFNATGGGKFLAAYVVSDETIDIDKLNAFILERKPPYMVPAVTMQIDRIPLNQNQKVNKKALPVPEKKAEEIIAPKNETQQKIFDCIAEVIGSKEFGITTDIYGAGVTSIGAIRLNVLLAKTFDVVIRNQDLKENNTIEKLEKFIAGAGKAEAYEVYPDYPLTQTQNGIFVECVANVGTTIYNIPYLFKLSDKVDLQRLKTAVEQTINAHPYVKTTLFLNDQGDVRAARNDFDKPLVEMIACERIPSNEELVPPYDLVESSLYRAKIYQTDEGNYLFLDFHHIICDGTSEGILIRDINRAYDGEVLETESYSGFEIALDEEKLRGTDAYEKAKKYYDSIFEGIDSNFLPPKDGNASVEDPREADFVSEISVDEIKAYCQKNDITLNAFFNGVFAVVLSKYNYRDEAVYTTIYNGRNDARLEDSVSMLVKTLPVYCRTEGNLKIVDMLKTMKNHLFDSMTNDLYSFGEISRAYNLPADILFAYQGDSFAFDTIAGEKTENCAISLNAVKAPLSIDVLIYDGKLTITAEYQNDRYARETILGLLDCMNKVTEEFLCKTYIKDISMMCDSACEQMERFNDTDYPLTEVPVHRLFERQVELHADETAVIAAGKKLTYKELNNRANRLAQALLQGGLTVGEAVGIILPRIVDVPVAEFGILKAGGAFLPMLPDYPDDRISYCLKDSGSRFVVTTKAIKEEKKDLFAKENYNVLTVEDLETDEDIANLNREIPVDSLAYIIYTSGSTGTPKGVMIEHRNLCNFVDANPKNHETVNFVSYGKTALSVAAISFDFSLMEIHIPLCNGMAVCMANEEEIYNPLSLLRLIKENHVDVISGTPSFISNFVDIPLAEEVLRQVKMYDFGAEAFPETLYEKLHKLSPEAVIVNGYGPTEATISCISKVMDGSGKVTIGTPAANVRAYICDLSGNILPAGARGELVICGAGVGRGYVNLPEKTEEVFITLDGRKAYRSGDLARYNQDGEIEFFGRLDNQVKLRGLRVELDEISSVMSTYPSVTHAIVLVKGEGQQQFLCGYYVAEKTIDKADLTDHMKKSLAPYMIPSVLIQLDTMPLTANGKINKKALPEPETSTVHREYEAPMTGLQSKLAEMFAMALGMEKVGITEDFFALGGTSLTASKVAMKAMLENIPIAYADIFDNPTVEKLERFILAKQGREVQTMETSLTEKSEMEETGVAKVLSHNSNRYVDEVAAGELGDVLLTGATGFLGIHVLKALLEKTDNTVYCLIRRGKSANVEVRLKSMLVYYFSDSMEEMFGKRIQVVEGDITDVECVEGLKQYGFQTVINCAACVKHFVNDDILDRINVHGVENLIKFCSQTGRRLVQISTVSIAGDNVNGKFPEEKNLHENELFFGQGLENKYILTKFLAEKAVLEAVAEGKLDGKVIRVGNLMSRHSDGEFQINFVTNGFMRTLRGYAAIGKFPVSAMDELEEFSPIDCTADAIVRLSGVNSEFTVFHACNSHRVQMGDVIEAMNHCGLKVGVVSDEEFARGLADALADEQKNMLVSGLISYLSSDSQNTVKYIDYNNVFTIKTLYRLGYKWPITDDKYLENAFMALKTLGFFDGN